MVFDLRMHLRDERRPCEIYFVSRLVDLGKHDHPQGIIAGYAEDFVEEMTEKILESMYVRAKPVGDEDDTDARLEEIGLEVPSGVYFYLETIDKFTGDAAKELDQTVMTLSVAHVQGAIDEMVSRSARLGHGRARGKGEEDGRRNE